MLVLFDQGTTLPLRSFLPNHDCQTAHERGWSRLKNSDLLTAAEDAKFDLLLTTDKNLRYQQNLSTRTIGILVMPTTSWPRLRRMADQIATAVDRAAAGTYVELSEH